ncbi:745_t:CDS:2, partial [Gigaspora rosea]
GFDEQSKDGFNEQIKLCEEQPFQVKDSTFQSRSCNQSTSFTSSNIEIDHDNFEYDEHLDSEFNDQSDYEFEEEAELYEGQLFNTVDEAYAAVEAFAHSNRFGIRKGRVEKDTSNNREISRTFLCHHAGKLLKEKTSYKTEESGSCRTDCKWKLNKYNISTFTNVHTGHTPDPTTIRFIPKNRNLTSDMLKDIEYYTVIGKLNSSAQYRLLFGKYKIPIHRRN